MLIVTATTTCADRCCEVRKGLRRKLSEYEGDEGDEGRLLPFSVRPARKVADGRCKTTALLARITTQSESSPR
jgi:hypothetical protein